MHFYHTMEKKKRNRRTAKDIEQTILNATGELIEKNGFSNVTLSDVLQKAKIEPGVFYKRYNSLTDLFEKYVRTYDYWMNDAFDFNPAKNVPEQNCENLLIGLVDAINSNPSMQKILAWEVAEDNYITRRTAKNREIHTEPLIDYFIENYTDSKIDIRVVSALLTSGIYYLCLHKDMSTFCHIDFSTEEGLTALKTNIKEIIKRLYQNQKPSK